jgi:transposase-like protein
VIQKQASWPRKESTAVEHQTTVNTSASIPSWETLEDFAREGMRQLLQRVLEEEVDQVLGRSRCQRRSPVDPQPGYRNGFGKPRQLTLSNGTITIQRPRVRGMEQRFVSRILPLFERRTKEVGELLPQLYLHGLAEGDFDLALRGLLGQGAPLSAPTIARLKAVWQAEYDLWCQRPLYQLDVVYLWVDGIYVKAGLEKEKAALLTVIAGLRDGRKVVLAVSPGHRESTEAWSAILRDLKQRGVNCPKLVVGDGHLGIWGALANVFPQAKEQRCWNHRIMNVLDKIGRQQQAQARMLLTRIPAANSQREAEQRKREFQAWCRKRGFEAAAEVLDRDWQRMLTFYGFPQEHWQHLRTTNIVESPFAVVRLRTTAAKRYKKVANATAVIWKTLLVAQQTFERLNAPELLADVADGVEYVDGKRKRKSSERKVPA